MTTTSETLDKIAPALVAARKAMLPAAKGGENKFDRYKYATEEDWCAAVIPPLTENGLTLLFSATEISDATERPTKAGGKEFNRIVKGTVRLLHESGQWIETACAGEGQDRGDKAIYQAMTGMKKYGYAMLLALPTSDDPEKHGDKDAYVPTPEAPPVLDVEGLKKAVASCPDVSSLWTSYCHCRDKYNAETDRETIRVAFAPSIRNKILAKCSGATIEQLGKMSTFVETTAKGVLLGGDLTVVKGAIFDAIQAAPPEPTTP